MEWITLRRRMAGNEPYLTYLPQGVVVLMKAGGFHDDQIRSALQAVTCLMVDDHCAVTLLRRQRARLRRRGRVRARQSQSAALRGRFRAVRQEHAALVGGLLALDLLGAGGAESQHHAGCGFKQRAAWSGVLSANL